MFGLNELKQTRFYQDVKAEGKAEGKTEEAVSLILRIIKRKLQEINPETEKEIRQLSVEQLEELGEALLDFETEVDLVNWLETNLGNR